MGRKFVMGYGFNIGPGFISLVNGSSDRPFNTVHEFFVEATVNKKVSLGTSLRLYNYTYNNVAIVNAYDSPQATNANQIDDSPRGSYDMKGRNFTFYAKSYRSKYLAPWGKYFMFGLSITSYTTTYKKNVMKVLFERNGYNSSGVYENTQFYVSDFGPTTEVFRGADVFFGQGKSRIYGDRIVFDFGYNINVFAMSRMLVFVFEDYYYESAEYIEKTSRSREAAVNRFNVYFKLGYLF